MIFNFKSNEPNSIAFEQVKKNEVVTSYTNRTNDKLIAPHKPNKLVNMM